MSIIKSYGSGDVATSGFYNGVATQSLRFDIASTSYLKRQPDASNRKTYVLSFWLKPSKDTLNSGFLVARTGSGGTYTNLCFSASNNTIRVVDNQGSYPALQTSGKYRDVSAWYHIVFAVDTTQSTDSNKLKVYVNGTEQSYGTSYYYTTNDDTNINSTDDHYIGYNAGVANLDGYLAEYNFIDGLSFFSDTSGTANTSFNINSFGETKNGVWIAKAYSGSYGTNGYRLAFNSTDFNTSGSSTMTDPHGSGTAVPANGLADASGQGNHWTTNGIGAVDFVPDSPENNFSILNRLYIDQEGVSGPATLEEGNLKVTGTGPSGQWNNIFSTIPVSSGKWYVEFYGSGHVGILASNAMPTGYFSLPSDGYSYYFTGQKVNGGTFTSYGSGFFNPNNNIVGLALDLDNGTLHFYNDNVLQGSGSAAFTGLSGKEYIIGCAVQNTTATMRVNFGQDSTFAGVHTTTHAYQQDSANYANASDGNGKGKFFFTPPSGYLALCSDNLAEPTIGPNSLTQAVNHFGVLTYTGGGSASRSIVSGGVGIGGKIDFKPDWLWVKARDGTYYHGTWDSSRTNKSALYPNETDNEDTSTAGTIGSLDTNGFTTPNVGSGGFINIGSTTYVAWNWKAGGATPSKTYKVKVVSDSTDFGHGTGSNKYQFFKSDGSTGFGTNGVYLDLQEGGTYTFDWSDSSAQSHPIRFSLTNDGTHSNGTSAGSEYTTGVLKDDSAYKTTITVASGVASLYYYCQNHSGMGAEVRTNASGGQTNFDGSLLSVVQANTTAGFSIVTYTGNGSAGATIGHGLDALNKVPDALFIYNRDDDTEHPMTFPNIIGANKYLYIHAPNGDASFTNFFNDTNPTSSVFSVGSDNRTNGSTKDFVAYLFTSIEGYSKFGSYVGNGETSGDGTFAFLGFRPAFIMIKNTTASAEWVMVDSVRSTFNEVDDILAADDTSKETDFGTTNRNIDFLSNGFKIRSNAAGGTTALNTTSSIYTYMAFAEVPFKYANAR